ncbi:HD family phosphohydrolase [Altericista sp. CCNU0014]|uniref:HD family phosphohydrolase n=1 Tax=Altericista sp. CCNU0014 TaxID=3082949 RepID=UPI00384AA294
MKGLKLGSLSERMGFCSPSVKTRRGPTFRRSALLALLALLALTGTIGYRFYNEPQLTVNTRAPQTIYAPRTAIVEDKIATAIARKAARQTALNVFTLSQPLTETIENDLSTLMIQAQAIRKLAGPFPFLPTATLSIQTQQILRRLSLSELEALLAAVTSRDRLAEIEPSPELRQSATELSAFYRKAGLTAPQWARMRQTVIQANERYQLAKRSVAAQLVTLQVEPILDLPDREWETFYKKLRVVLRRMLAQGVAPGLLGDVTKKAVAAQVDDWSAPHREAAIQLLPKVLRSNLAIEPGETLRQQEQAAQQIQPIQVSIRKGEEIVRKNQPITSASFALLDSFGLSQRRVNVPGLLMTGLAVGVALGLFAWLKGRYYQRWSHQRWSPADTSLVLLLSLGAPLLIGLTEVTYTPLPAVGLLLGSFYGSAIGAIVVVLLGFLVPLGLPSAVWPTFAAIAIGSLVGSLLAGHVRSREELARVGLVLGVVQAVAYAIFLGSTSNPGIYSLTLSALRQGLIGVGWCIIALGLSPYLEKLFDLITPIRLAELANPNRPLLKQLAEEAPGTFQHTQLVTTLAEAGARALNCNVELVRTGTLYHDIGKMHDPQAFIENQFGCPNKHTDLDDPWLSAHLIRQHVEQGLVMARKAGLPSAVQAFIPEHQGTMLIAYFYHQACQHAQQSTPPIAIQERDFRYEGPTPQSRETGIVMLADSCEAALRAMKQKDPKVALRTVKQIFKTRWEDGQLVDASLSREDLESLANIFVQVWQQVNHERIAYPPPVPVMPRQIPQRGA